MMRQRIPNTAGQAGTRLVIVDALRAVALLGIIVTHASTGFLVGPPPVPDFMSFSALDRVIAKWVPILVEGKFFTIFSFLFGLSFAIQLERARRAGKPFAGRYAWRLLILMGIGFVHSLFFGGDILMIYALLGLLLLPVHKLRSRTLVITALILILNLPGLVLGTLFLAAPAQTPQQQQAQTKQFERSALQQFEIKTKGTPRELVTLNLTESVKNRVFFQLYTGRLWITYGLFLLGICAGRARLFEHSEASTKFFVRLMVASGVAAAAATVFVVLYPASFERTLRTVVSWYVGTIQHSLLAAFYVAAAALLLRKPGRCRHAAPGADGPDGSHVVPLAERVRRLGVLRHRPRAAGQARRRRQHRIVHRLLRRAAVPGAMVDDAIPIRSRRMAVAIADRPAGAPNAVRT
jgi:uncharacterized protein